MFYFPQGLLCVPAEDKMTQKTLKYRMLLKAFRMLPVKRIMAGTPEKTQKIFKKAYKGVEIPELHDPEISVSRGEIKGQAVLYYRHRKETDRVGIYLVGGGMLKYPKPSQAEGLVSLAKETGINILLPYYPLVFEGSTLTDVYEMLYELYKKTLRKYRPENICFMGGSSGGNLAIGMASYINDRGEGLPMPGKIYAGSPGTLLLTEEEKRRAGELEKTDVIMSVKATENIWEGMTGGEKVPEYMKYLQLGNYYGLSDVYMSFGGDEVFLAGADSIRRRLEEFGTHVTVEIGEGMYHSYAMMPLVEDAQEGYRHFVEYIKE